MFGERHAVADYMSICVHAQHPHMYFDKVQRHNCALSTAITNVTNPEQF